MIISAALLAADFVVDNVVTMAWFFPDEATPHTDALRKRLDRETAAVPSLWPLEAANIMLMGERRGRTTQAEANEFIDLLNDLPIIVDDQTPAVAFAAILPLARTQKLTVYDAAYLELALRLGLPLATLDKALRTAAASLGVVLL